MEKQDSLDKSLMRGKNQRQLKNGSTEFKVVRHNRIQSGKTWSLTHKLKKKQLLTNNPGEMLAIKSWRDRMAGLDGLLA